MPGARPIADRARLDGRLHDPIVSGFPRVSPGGAGDGLPILEDMTVFALLAGIAIGLVIGYLPKEKILVYADMFNLPPANDPVPNPPVVGTMIFLDNIARLNLDPDKVMSIHSLNPDRLTTVAEMKKSLGRN